MFGIELLIIIPPFLMALWAQSLVKSNFAKYSQVRAKRGLTGAQVAEALLRHNGIKDVNIEKVSGDLTDHYDPRSKTVRLSQNIHDSTSVAALSIAAHEVGHAVQHDVSYTPLTLRSAILPAAQIGSNAGIWMFMIGLMITMFAGGGIMSDQIMLVGIVLFTAAVAFQVITLPVEFNASSRAIDMLEEFDFLDKDEVRPAKHMLNAAALTYVAATAMAIAQLIRLLLIFANTRRG